MKKTRNKLNNKNINTKISKTTLEDFDFMDLDEENYLEEEYFDESDDFYDEIEEAKPISRNRRHNGKDSGLWYKIKYMDTIDRVVTSTGALIMVFAIVTCTLYTNAKVLDRQVVSFEEIGAQMEGIEVIGESGLLAMADAQSAKTVGQEDIVETEYEEIDLETKGSVLVEMNLSSMQKDLKIKFINKKTGKLVANVPFEVSITDVDKKTYTLTDEDKDGVIYQADMTPGKCSVVMEDIKGSEDYAISTESVSVTIKDKIEYKKVDVSDEVKKESEVNAAIEDTKVQDTTVESVLTDTVAWVESTKTATGGSGDGTGYEKVSKDRAMDLSSLVNNGSKLESDDKGSYKASYVSGNTVLFKITINATSAELLTGKTAKLTAKIEGEADNSVIWSSDKDGVATVSADGTITAVAEGTAVITATNAKYSSTKVTCKVTVSKHPESDSSTKLKDKDGNQLFIKESEGKYREAVYSDYFKNDKFYKAVQNTEYKYTGWQTIDGKTYYFNADGNKVTGEQVIQGAKYNFDSDGILQKSSGNMGIDVSKWNGNIDWNAVKNSGVSYVIIRCGYRGSTTGALIEDPKFRSNIQGATAAGIKVGIYFFTQAVNEVEAVEEASMVLSLISGYKISYPVFLDVEPSGGRADGISKDTRTAVCRAFCQTIQNSGYTAGIYANKTWFSSYINTGSLTGYKIWLAQYAAAPTYTATKYDMWQYSSKGSVAGIKGNVDMNISYLGY